MALVHDGMSRKLTSMDESFNSTTDSLPFSLEGINVSNLKEINLLLWDKFMFIFITMHKNWNFAITVECCLELLEIEVCIAYITYIWNKN